MASVFNWCQDTGTLSSGHGTTRSGFGADTHYATDCNWKNADDCTANGGTAYSAAPIVAGNNSYSVYQYGKWTGTWNQILSVVWSPRTSPAGALATGLHLKATVSSTYATPSTTANAALTTDVTSAPLAIGSGLAVNLGSDPSTASTSSVSGGGTAYSAYLISQLQTDNTAAAGDMAAITQTIQWSEN